MRHGLIDLTPLRSSPAFRRLWIGRAWSGFGTQMTLVAVMFQVWHATHSTIWTGAVGLAQAAPLIGLGLLAGSLIDRSDRRRIYLITITGQAVCSILLVVQAILVDLPVLGLLAIVAAQGCFGAAGGPVARTVIPRLLGPDQLAAGLALNRITFQGSVLIGPALAGLIIGWLGVGGCYAIDVVTFAASFYGAFGLPRMLPTGDAPRAGLAGVRDGLTFLLRTAPVRGALLTDLAATVLSYPVSLFPLINAERFDNNPRTFGLFLTAIAVGGVIASIFSGGFTRSARPGLVMLIGSGSWGAAVALFAICPNRWAAMGFLVLAGAADTVSVVCRSTIVQFHTPDAMRGRVAAVEQMVGQAGPDIGNLRGGLVASATSGSVALISGGLLCVAAVAAVGATTPGLRRFVRLS